MRAIVAHPGPHFSVADVYDGWVAGLEASGVRVMPYNLHDRLEVFESSYRSRGGAWVKTVGDHEDCITMASEMLKAAAYDWWPQLIVIVSGFFVPTRLVDRLRAHGHKVVLLATESPYQDDKQLEWAAHYDAVVLNDPTNLDRFQSVADSLYIPHGHDPQRHHPGPPTPGLEADFTFVGTGYPSRIAFLEKVEWDGIDVSLAGNWQSLKDDSPLLPYLAHPQSQCCPNDQTVALYQSATTSANLYRVEADRPELAEGWAMGPREVELAAVGTWFARNPRPEGDALFPMLPTFTEPAELGDLIRWALAHPDERDTAAASACAAVADRTFAGNARRLLTHLGF